MVVRALSERGSSTLRAMPTQPVSLTRASLRIFAVLSLLLANVCAPSLHAFAQAKPRQTPMEVANACLARGDDACVVRALQGKAKTQSELGILIETYRKLGDTEHAQELMRRFVDRYPDATRSASYRRMLGVDAVPEAPRDPLKKGSGS